MCFAKPNFLNKFRYLEEVEKKAASLSPGDQINVYLHVEI